MRQVRSLTTGWLCVLGLGMTACEPVPPTEGALPPMEAGRFAPPPGADAPRAGEASSTPAPDAPEGGDTDVAEAAVDDAPGAAPEGDDDLSDAELMALALGQDPAGVSEVEGASDADRGTVALAMPADDDAEADRPAWSPGTPIDGGWGVRLLSTLPDAQPPRAILALGSGEEIVVEPATMVPRAQLVVTAIGRDAVQIAHVVPSGDRARIDTQTLVPMYTAPTRSGRRGASRAFPTGGGAGGGTPSTPAAPEGAGE